MHTLPQSFSSKNGIKTLLFCKTWLGQIPTVPICSDRPLQWVLASTTQHSFTLDCVEKLANRAKCPDPDGETGQATTPTPPNGQAAKLYLLLLLASMCTDCSSTYELLQEGGGTVCGDGSHSSRRGGVHGDGLGTIKGRHRTLVSTLWDYIAPPSWLGRVSKLIYL